mgnify:CR=1 FL=1
MAFTGKVALVTGGASGMGRTTALQMANAGAKVAIFDMSDENLEKTAAESPNISAYKCDVTDLEQVKTNVARVEAELGPIDRLTQCAAIMPGDTIKNMSIELTNKQMLINYCGTVNMVKTVWDLMEPRGGGQIVVFGSMAGSVLTHGLGGYSATKAATNVFMEVLVRENPESPVQFLLVCPPMVNTPLVAQAVDKGPNSMKGAVANNRMSQSEDIIAAVEKALDKGDWRVTPGEAGIMMWIRRFSPALLWKLMEKANAT